MNDFLPQASEIASKVDALAFTLLVVSLLFSFAIGAVLIFFLVRYREDSDVDRTSPLIDRPSLEVIWIVIPTLIAGGLFFWSAGLYTEMLDTDEQAVEILVVGKQWMWKVQHPSGKREINHLHLPADTPVRLTMISEDVIHSFFLPAFRVKRDVLPGRYHYLDFRPTKPGDYHIFCAEYCGSEHSQMRGTVTVMLASEYEEWMSNSEAPSVARGETLFKTHGCRSCHHPDSPTPAPSLEYLFGKDVTLEDGRTVSVDENYLRESILLPNEKVVAGFEPIMPTYQGTLTEEEVHSLVLYLKERGKAAGP